MTLIYSKLPVGPDHHLDGQNKDQGDIITPVTVKGGLYNGDFEIAPTFVAAQTQSNWINGAATGSATDDKYGWCNPAQTALRLLANQLNSYCNTVQPLVSAYSTHPDILI